MIKEQKSKQKIRLICILNLTFDINCDATKVSWQCGPAHSLSSLYHIAIKDRILKKLGGGGGGGGGGHARCAPSKSALVNEKNRDGTELRYILMGLK